MRKKIDLLILLFVLVVGTFTILNAQALGDWWHQQSYTPSSEIVSLADSSGMNEKGRKLFYRFGPELVSKSRLNEVCGIEQLGCVEGNSMYILEATNPGEQNRNIVTANHEMLHIAYSRLSTDEQAGLESLINKELEKSAGKGVVKKLSNYPQDEKYNEGHSFIGSEIKDLSRELEGHYSIYFSNRSKSIEAYSNSPEK